MGVGRPSFVCRVGVLADMAAPSTWCAMNAGAMTVDIATAVSGQLTLRIQLTPCGFGMDNTSFSS
jgi:hypothetical protein